jgi:hypothetical protein
MLPVGEDLLGFADVDDELGTQRDLNTERSDRWRPVEDRLERVSGLDPVVVATIEQADVVDARITEDERRSTRGDLPGPSPGHFSLAWPSVSRP